jgi:hypothetical protein
MAALMSFVTGLDFGAPPGVPDDWVVGDARASAEARVGVYRYMYGARLVEALESQFPCVAAALGAAGFGAAVRSYAARSPSRNPSIRELGRWLAEHLRSEHSTVEPGARAALGDLAELEWARADVFDALDEELVTVDFLRAQPPEAFADLRLTRIQASRLVTLDHPIASWWDELSALSRAAQPSGQERQERQEDGPAADAGSERDSCCSDHAVAGGSPDAGSLGSRPGPGRQAILVWRDGVSIFHRAVDPREERALRGLADGTTLGALCDPLAEDDVDVDLDVVVQIVFGWLWTWAKDGLLR